MKKGNKIPQIDILYLILHYDLIYKLCKTGKDCTFIKCPLYPVGQNRRYKGRQIDWICSALSAKYFPKEYNGITPVRDLNPKALKKFGEKFKLNG